MTTRRKSKSTSSRNESDASDKVMLPPLKNHLDNHNLGLDGTNAQFGILEYSLINHMKRAMTTDTDMMAQIGMAVTKSITEQVLTSPELVKEFSTALSQNDAFVSTIASRLNEDVTGLSTNNKDLMPSSTDDEDTSTKIDQMEEIQSSLSSKLNDDVTKLSTDNEDLMTSSAEDNTSAKIAQLEEIQSAVSNRLETLMSHHGQKCDCMVFPDTDSEIAANISDKDTSEEVTYTFDDTAALDCQIPMEDIAPPYQPGKEKAESSEYNVINVANDPLTESYACEWVLFLSGSVVVLLLFFIIYYISQDVDSLKPCKTASYRTPSSFNYTDCIHDPHH